MSYATLDQLKTYVGIPTADTADDQTLQQALDAASGQIEAWCDRIFRADQTPTTRYYNTWPAGNFQPGRFFGSWTGYVDIDPLSATTGLVVKTDDAADGTYATTWTLDTDYRLEPVNATLKVPPQPWTRLVAMGRRYFPKLYYRPGVQVTGTFGWPGSAPAEVIEATLIQASRLWKRKDAPFGVAGSVEFGSEIRLLNELDRDAQNLLAKYRRSWWVA